MHDVHHYLPFPWTERLEARVERTQGLFILTPKTIASEAEVDRVNQILITARLGQELNGTTLHRLHRHWDVTVRRYEDDRDLDICGCELVLKIQTASLRHSNVENETGGTFRAFGFEEVGNGRK
jgi:hypothetical protein